MEYRLLTLDDYDEIFSLWSSIEGMGLRSLDDSRSGIDKFLRRNPALLLQQSDRKRLLECRALGEA